MLQANMYYTVFAETSLIAETLSISSNLSFCRFETGPKTFRDLRSCCRRKKLITPIWNFLDPKLDTIKTWSFSTGIAHVLRCYTKESIPCADHKKSYVCWMLVSWLIPNDPSIWDTSSSAYGRIWLSYIYSDSIISLKFGIRNIIIKYILYNGV